MECLPKDIENIIMTYKYQLDFSESVKKIKEIRKITVNGINYNNITYEIYRPERKDYGVYIEFEICPICHEFLLAVLYLDEDKKTNQFCKCGHDTEIGEINAVRIDYKKKHFYKGKW